MKVNFKTYSGTIHTLELPPNSTIGDARSVILNLKIINTENPTFKLIYDGEELPNNKSISDLNLQDDSPIIIQLEGNGQQSSNEEEEEEEELLIEPENFDSLVTELAELGYERDACEAALKITRFEVEDAANLLINENNRDVVFIENERRRIELEKEQNDDSDYYNEEEEVITKRTTLGPFREVYEKYSAEEKNVIDKLAKKLGFDSQTIIQVFEACEKNPEATEAALLGSNFK